MSLDVQTVYNSLHRITQVCVISYGQFCRHLKKTTDHSNYACSSMHCNVQWLQYTNIWQSVGHGHWILSNKLYSTVNTIWFGTGKILQGTRQVTCFIYFTCLLSGESAKQLQETTINLSEKNSTTSTRWMFVRSHNTDFY